MKTNFFTFADDAFIERARPKNGGRRCIDRVAMEAARVGFDCVYGMEQCELAEWPHYSKASGTRLFYWGGWKPWFALRLLGQMADGDLLVYSDAGNTIARNDAKWHHYFELAESYGFVGWQDSHLDVTYTKMDTIAHFGGVEVAKLGQLWSGAFILQKRDWTVRLMQDWNAAFDDVHLVDDSPSVAPNDPSFVEHRHDQSVLSLLIKRIPNALWRDCLLPHSENYGPTSVGMPIQATRLR